MGLTHCESVSLSFNFKKHGQMLLWSNKLQLCKLWESHDVQWNYRQNICRPQNHFQYWYIRIVLAELCSAYSKWAFTQICLNSLDLVEFFASLDIFGLITILVWFVLENSNFGNCINVPKTWNDYSDLMDDWIAKFKFPSYIEVNFHISIIIMTQPRIFALKKREGFMHSSLFIICSQTKA